MNSVAPETQSIPEIVTEPDSSITTDATDSVVDLINDQETCTDENGNTFNHLDDVPSSDPCKLCQCTNGVVVCAEEECALPEPYYESCKPLPIEPGKCCPQYECELPETSTAAETGETEAENDLIQFDDVDGEQGEVETATDDYEVESSVGAEEEPTAEIIEDITTISSFNKISP